MKVLMQLDFKELNDLEVLPESLKQYSVDLKWKTPSLFHDRMRETELLNQRELANKREMYIKPYFTKVKMLYSGELVLKAREILLGFLRRWDSVNGIQNRAHKLMGQFSSMNGLSVTPKRETFKCLIRESFEKIYNAFLLDDKQLGMDVILEIEPTFDFQFSDGSEIFQRFTEIGELENRVYENIDTVYDFFDHELENHSELLQSLSTTVGNTVDGIDLRDVEKLEVKLQFLLNVREDLSKRPRQIFHKVNRDGDLRADFVVDMRCAWESALKLLDNGMRQLKDRLLDELNNVLFNEIQEKWTEVKDKKLGRDDCAGLEARMLLFALMAVAIANAWPDGKSKCKAAVETVMRLYQALADRTVHTHSDGAIHFNRATEPFELPPVKLRVEKDGGSADYEEEASET
jgi:hypothetical protein